MMLHCILTAIFVVIIVIVIVIIFYLPASQIKSKHK